MAAINGEVRFDGRVILVTGAARCLAVDGAPHGILVNAVAPSAATRMTDGFAPGTYADWFNRTMAPERVAPGAAFLLSDECTLTGEVLAMGGGRIARIVLAEAEGVFGAGDSIEDVRAMMPQVAADRTFFFPANLAELSQVHFAKIPISRCLVRDIFPIM